MKRQLITGDLKVSNLLVRAVMILLLLSIGLGAQSQEMQLSAISHQKGPPSAMNLSELKSIFKGEKQRWPDGTKISIALMKTNNPVGQTICKKIYDMSGDELNKFWLALVFQGKVSAPNFFNSVDELEDFVAEHPGAIGIINEQAHTSAIKTLNINGRKTF